MTRSPRRALALVALIAFAVATHSATFAVLLALVAAAALARVIFGDRLGRRDARGGAALALGALLLLSANYVTSGRFAWTPGGVALSFGRMLQDGIVARYLDEHCPDKRLKPLRAPARTARRRRRVLLEGDGSVFNRLGRFDGPRRRDGT